MIGVDLCGLALLAMYAGVTVESPQRVSEAIPDQQRRRARICFNLLAAQEIGLMRVVIITVDFLYGSYKIFACQKRV